MRTPVTRNPVRILVALALCLGLQMTGYLMILPLFARRFESFGAGVEALGLSAMVYALTGTIAAPFVGMLADRFGRRPIILVSLAAHVVTFGGYLLATSASLLVLLRGLAGVLTAGLVPAISSAVGDVAAEDRRAQWIGIVNGSASVGWIAGPALGGLLYDRFGYVVPFAAAVSLAMISLLLALVLVPETARHGPQAGGTPLASLAGFRGLSARPALYLLLLISFGVVFAWAFVEPQFMFYAYDDLSWSSSQLGLVISVYGSACAFGEFALGRLSDRLGRKPVLVWGLALFSTQFIGLIVSRDVTWIGASFVVAGLGNALFDPALSAHILDITPPEQTARVMGLKSTVASLGGLLGPGLVVLAAPIAGPRGVFLISGSLVWLLTLVTALAPRTRQLPEAVQASS